MRGFAIVFMFAACDMSAAQVLETMQDYAELGHRFADYAAGKAPTDAGAISNVLSAGVSGNGGCPNCSFLESSGSGEVADAHVRVTGSGSSKLAADLARSVKINVAKSQDIPKEILNLVEAYEQKRNEEERSMLDSALHAIPQKRTSLLARSTAPFDLKVKAGARAFPSFYESIRQMEETRRESEERVRSKLMASLTKVAGKKQQSGGAAALAETVAQLQKKAFENPAYAAEVLAQINQQFAPHAAFLGSRATPSVNVKLELPVADSSRTAKSQLSLADFHQQITSQQELLNKVVQKAEHSQFLRDNSEFERKTQAPMVWLHLNEAKPAAFLSTQQAVTPDVDLYLEQGSQ